MIAYSSGGWARIPWSDVFKMRLIGRKMIKMKREVDLLNMQADLDFFVNSVIDEQIIILVAKILKSTYLFVAE